MCVGSGKTGRMNMFPLHSLFKSLIRDNPESQMPKVVLKIRKQNHLKKDEREACSVFSSVSSLCLRYKTHGFYRPPWSRPGPGTYHDGTFCPGSESLTGMATLLCSDSGACYWTPQLSWQNSGSQWCSGTWAWGGKHARHGERTRAKTLQ